jgi:hypothetical protein
MDGVNGKKKKTAKKGAKAPKKLAERVKFGEKIYTKETCSRKESDAKKKVKKLRADGKLARVKKDPLTGSFCVFTRKRATKAKKKAA